MKYRIFAYLIILTLCVPGRLFADDLKGKVVFVGEQDDTAPAVGIDITIDETGILGKTKAGACFVLPCRTR